MRIKAIVVDDEPIVRRSILRFLEAHPTVQVQAECGDGPSAVSAILQHSPDVVFLDIQIPGFDGFHVLSEIGLSKMPLTVFVTAYAQYAVQAFEGRAVDYLVKPLGQMRFDEALSRVGQRLASQLPLDPPPQDENKARDRVHIEWIPLIRQGRVSPLKVGDVDWMEAEKNHVVLHLGRRVEVVRRTLNSLQESLDPRQFVRIHRSTIVNAERVREVHPWRNGHHVVMLESGQELRMSRYQQESARILLGKNK